MTRKFEIYNEKFKEVQAYLYLDTETETFSIELLDSYEGLHPDILFNIYHKMYPQDKFMAQHNVDGYIEGRVLPPNRHALSQYLSDMGLTEYNIVKILDYTKGRCPMDHSYFREIT